MMSQVNDAIRLAVRKGYRIINGECHSPSGKKRKLWKKPRKGHFGYWSFGIKLPGIGTVSIPVHRVLAYQKFGEEVFKDGIQVRHLDGDCLNNSDENITIGTATDNRMDMSPEIRRNLAIKAASKLQKHSEEMISSMRADHEAGMPYRKLTEKYGVPKSTVSYYISRNAKKRSVIHCREDAPIAASF